MVAQAAVPTAFVIECSEVIEDGHADRSLKEVLEESLTLDTDRRHPPSRVTARHVRLHLFWRDKVGYSLTGHYALENGHVRIFLNKRIGIISIGAFRFYLIVMPPDGQDPDYPSSCPDRLPSVADVLPDCDPATSRNPHPYRRPVKTPARLTGNIKILKN